MKNEGCEIILVGGVGRSGTSILSKLIASTSNSEFFYEPPIFMHFLETLHLLPENYDWKSLFDSIIYKDLMKGALSGRGLNLNKNDISSAYNYKSEHEIESRFKYSFKQEELDNKLRTSQAVIKVLDNIHQFNDFQKLYPHSKSIIIYRNPIDVIRSICQKGWFSDEQLSEKSFEPLRAMKNYNGYRIHYFINEEIHDKWLKMKETDKALYYYLFHINKFLDLVDNPNIIFICYDNLVKEPTKVYSEIKTKLRLLNGSRSNEILNSINLKSTTDTSIREEIKQSEFYDQCVDAYDSLNSRLK